MKTSGLKCGVKKSGVEMSLKKFNHDLVSGMRKDLEAMNYHGRTGIFTSKNRKKGAMWVKDAVRRSHFNPLSEESWLDAVLNKELRVL